MLSEDKEYVRLMEEQNKNIKTFSDLLTQAQFVLQNLTDKVGNTSIENTKQCKVKTVGTNNGSDKPVQPRCSKRLSKNKQVVKFLPDASKEVHKASIGVQVTCEQKEDNNKQNIVIKIPPVPQTCSTQCLDITQHEQIHSVKDLGNEKVSDEPEVVVKPEVTDKFHKHTLTEKTDPPSSTVKDNAVLGCCNEIQVEVALSAPNVTLLNEAKGPNIKQKALENKSQDKSDKKVKSLKDIGTETSSSMIISKINIQGNEHTEKVVNLANVDANTSTHCTDTECSTKGKLAIQIMPPIDIRRGLVTQKIPNITITATESLPQLEVDQKSNIAYEIVKHDSNDINNKVNEEAANATSATILEDRVKSDKEKEAAKRHFPTVSFSNIQNVQSDKLKQTSKRCSKCNCQIGLQENDMQTFKLKVSSNKLDRTVPPVKEVVAVTKGINPLTKEDMAKQLVINVTDLCKSHKTSKVPNQISIAVQTSNTSDSDSSSIPSYDYELKKFIPQELRQASVQTTFDLPLHNVAVRTYINAAYQTDTDSEPVFILPEPDVQETTSKVSTKVEQLAHSQKSHVLREFINDMITNDPDAENVLKSYQLLDEISRHDPEESIDEEKLSYIDQDVYKTFVNPEGLKCLDTLENKETNTSEVLGVNDDNLKVGAVSEISTKMPAEFYSAKSTQIGEAANTVLNDETHSNKLSMSNIDLKSISNILENVQEERPVDTRLQCESSFKKSPSKDILKASEFVLGEQSVSKELKNVQEEVADDVKLQNETGLKQNSSEDILKPTEHAVQEEILVDPRLQNVIMPRKSVSEEIFKDSTLSSTQYAYNFINANSFDTVSEVSNCTDDVIFEIQTTALRPCSQNLIYTSDNPHRQNLPSKFDEEKKTEIQNVNEESESQSEYVITHDISIQTSLSDSEEILDLHRFSKETVDKGVESLKTIAEKDVLVEDEPTATCCAKLKWPTKKKKRDDTYMQSVIEESLQKLTERNAADRNSRLHSSITSGASHMSSIELATRISTGMELVQRKSVKIEEPSEQILVLPKNEASNKESENAHLDKQKFGTDLINVDGDSFSSGSEFSNSQYSVNEDVHNNNNKTNKSVTKDDSKTDTVTTIMTVNVEQSKVITEPSLDELILCRNAPRGDDGDCVEVEHNYDKNNFLPTPSKYRTSPVYRHKHKTKKRASSTSSSEAATSESISDKTEEALSEGEIKCKCNASIGELHMCPYMKNLKSRVQYLKRHPQDLIMHEFGDPNVKITRQKAFYSNWVAYYVTRSPSPDSDGSVSPNNSKDSSGLVKK